jgi:hypothetical protein
LKIRDSIAQEITNLIWKKVDMCDRDKFTFEIADEDEETIRFSFEVKNELFRDLNFTMVMFIVEDVDICIDDNVITFGIDRSLSESFKELDELLNKKMIYWAKREYLDYFYEHN